MQPTYRCRCGTRLAVYEGERLIQCGVCGETSELPLIYWRDGAKGFSSKTNSSEILDTQPTYKCRCGTRLAVYEGERLIQCGVCGRSNELPAIYWQSRAKDSCGKTNELPPIYCQGRAKDYCDKTNELPPSHQQDEAKGCWVGFIILLLLVGAIALGYIFISLLIR